MRNAIVAVIAVLMLAVPISGCVGGEKKQEAPTKGIIYGTVRDTAGEPIEGVLITVVEANRIEETDIEGKYRMKNIEPGTYTITAEKEGYEKAERTINVAAGKETVVNFVLRAAGEPPIEVIEGPKTLEVYLTNKVIKQPSAAGTVIYELTTIKPSSEEKAPFGTGVGQAIVPAAALWSITINENMKILNNTKFKFWLLYETVPQVPLDIWAHLYKNDEEIDFQRMGALSPIMPGIHEYEVEFKTIGRIFKKDDILSLGITFFGINVYEQPVLFALCGGEHASGAKFVYEAEE